MPTVYSFGKAKITGIASKREQDFVKYEGFRRIAAKNSLLILLHRS